MLTLVILFTIFGIGAYYYMYSNLLKNTEQGIGLRAEVLREAGEEDITMTLRTSFQATTKEQELLKSLFLSRDETAALIEKLEGTATLAHVSHELSVDTKDESSLDAQNKEVLATSIKVYGSWSQVYHFLSLIENLPYKVNISDVRLDRVEGIADPKSKTSREPQWSASISAQFIKEI